MVNKNDEMPGGGTDQIGLPGIPRPGTKQQQDPMMVAIFCATTQGCDCDACKLLRKSAKTMTATMLASLQGS